MDFRTTEQIEQEITVIAKHAIAQIGGYILDVRVKGSRGSRSLVIIADTQPGITLDELTAVSREVEHQLDDSDLFTDNYTLEVTSPGLDWPLKTARDFRRRLGKSVRLEHTVPDMMNPVEGELVEVSDEDITLQTKELGELVLPLNQINQGTLVLDW